MTAHPSAIKPVPGTSTEIMNMNMSSRSSTASTFSTFLNPIKKTFGLKKRLSKRGTNALFRAISAENWELVCSIADVKPYKAEAWHNALGFFDAHRSSKILPLHQACIFHPTKLAITHIIQAYPYALQSKETGYGRVPLHIACHSNASIECIQVLVAHYPDASIKQDNIGRVPLHYALSNGASYDIVKTLMTAARQVAGPDGFRSICSVSDFNGWLPVHVACFMGASAQVLQLIVSAYPEGVDAPTKKNSTPRGLLKGTSMVAQKKDALDAILKSRGSARCGFAAYASRVSPARTNMEKVVKMSDETCSKGVTLEIDEDETSSLSSIDTTRTGLTKKSRSRRRWTHVEYNVVNHSNPSLNLDPHSHSHSHANHNYIPNNNTNANPYLNPNSTIPSQFNRSSSYRSSSRRMTPSPQLPTHSIYNAQEQEQEHHIIHHPNNNQYQYDHTVVVKPTNTMYYPPAPAPLPPPPFHNTTNTNINATTTTTNNPITTINHKVNGPSARRRIMPGSVTDDNSNVSSDDDASANVIFQPITSTAAFC